MRVDSTTGEDFRVGLGDFAEDLLGLLDWGLGGNADRHFETTGFALQGVVHDSALENNAIRDEDFDTILTVELAAPGANRGDGAGEGPDFDKITDADGALEEENQATDQIVDELLGTESDGDRGGSTQQGEDGKGDLNGGEGDETDKEEKRVVGEFLDDCPRGGVEIQALADTDA